jgi:hypothetical protein
MMTIESSLYDNNDPDNDNEDNGNDSEYMMVTID